MLPIWHLRDATSLKNSVQLVHGIHAPFTLGSLQLMLELGHATFQTVRLCAPMLALLSQFVESRSLHWSESLYLRLLCLRSEPKQRGGLHKLEVELVLAQVSHRAQ